MEIAKQKFHSLFKNRKLTEEQKKRLLDDMKKAIENTTSSKLAHRCEFCYTERKQKCHRLDEIT